MNLVLLLADCVVKAELKVDKTVNFGFRVYFFGSKYAETQKSHILCQSISIFIVHGLYNFRYEPEVAPVDTVTIVRNIIEKLFYKESYYFFSLIVQREV